VTIPNGTTLLGYGSFSSSGLTSITIPGSVTSIAMLRSSNATSLTNITIDNGVAQVGALRSTGTRDTVTFPESVTYVGPSAFYACQSLAHV